MNENEQIALAAGLGWDFSRHPAPNWRNDPGAVATYLLPVLEKREKNVVFDRDDENENGPWLCSISKLSDLIYAPTWHEAVIEAVLASSEEVE